VDSKVIGNIDKWSGSFPRRVDLRRPKASWVALVGHTGVHPAESDPSSIINRW